MNKLPDKPSELIRLALTDLDVVEKNGAYKVHMMHFHVPNYDGTCLVCFAGAVMANTLHVQFDTLVAPSDLDLDTANKLHALDLFRNGSVGSGLVKMCKKGPPWPASYDRYVSPYHRTPIQFKRDMEKLAQELSEMGL